MKMKKSASKKILTLGILFVLFAGSTFVLARPPTDPRGPIRERFLNECTAYVCASHDIIIFGYTDNTRIFVYNSVEAEVWNGTLNESSYQHLSGYHGNYQIVASEKFAVLCGAPVISGVCGYYAMDQDSFGLSTEFYTYMPPVTSCGGEQFVIFSYTDGTQATITNLNNRNTIQTGILNKGQHFSSADLCGCYLKIESNNPVSALSYSDQGFYIPSSNKHFSGTEFYTYAGCAHGWKNTLHIMVYENQTMVTVKNTMNDTVYWSGILNKGKDLTINTTTPRYYTIISNKTVTVGLLPLISQTHVFGGFVPDYLGTGIGTEFYTISTYLGTASYLVAFAYEPTTVYMYNAVTNVLVQTDTITPRGGMNIWNNYGYYHILSDHPISIYGGCGVSDDPAQASFVPVKVASSQWVDPSIITIGKDSLENSADCGGLD
jgi:hypothetical protein